MNKKEENKKLNKQYQKVFIVRWKYTENIHNLVAIFSTRHEAEVFINYRCKPAGSYVPVRSDYDIVEEKVDWFVGRPYEQAIC